MLLQTIVDTVRTSIEDFSEIKFTERKIGNSIYVFTTQQFGVPINLVIVKNITYRELQFREKNQSNC